VVPSSCDGERWLPRSLRCVTGAPKCGAQEKAGHSGRDDKIGEEKRKNGPPRWAGPTNAGKENGEEELRPGGMMSWRRGCTKGDEEDKLEL